MASEVVVRFAPSPTGYLHIGGARTAIFNWLFAKKHNGTFILRIEDTDAERSSEDAIRGIVDGMRWLGLDWDVGPDFQSHHAAAHAAAADKLLSSGHAYKCFCKQERLEAEREAARSRKETYRYSRACRDLPPETVAEKEAAGMPYTVRLKVPAGEGGVRFEDAVYGCIEKRYADIEDFIIVRSNGKPLYVLSNAVDDIRDGVSHVIRGQDGLANTPKQILLYEALGAPLPVFAHMSLALDPEKTKISKRKHGESVAVQFYRDRGFLPWAMVNFLVLIGWSTPDNREFFTRSELIDAFSFSGISRSNPVIDIRHDDPKFFTDPKAVSMNAHYIRTLPVEALVPFVAEQLEKDGLPRPSDAPEAREAFSKTVDLIRGRFHLLTDFTTLGRAYFSDDFSVDPEARRRHLISQPLLREKLPELGARFAAMASDSASAYEQLLRDAAIEFGVKVGVLVNGVRVAVTGHAVGPGFIECLQCIGRQRIAARLMKAAELFT